MPNSLFIGYAISQPVYSKCDTADTTKNKNGTWKLYQNILFRIELTVLY